MEASTLVELAEKKLDDLTERHDYFVSQGDNESASFIADEGLILAQALNNNDTFFCLPCLDRDSIWDISEVPSDLADHNDDD